MNGSPALPSVPMQQVVEKLRQAHGKVFDEEMAMSTEKNVHDRIKQLVNYHNAAKDMNVEHPLRQKKDTAR